MVEFTKKDMDDLTRKVGLLRGIGIPVFVDALSAEEWLDGGGYSLLGFPNEEVYRAHQEIWRNVPRILAAVEEAQELLRYWGQSHRCYYPTREAGLYCCRICKYPEGGGHDVEANCIIGRTEAFVRAAEEQCD